MLFNEFIFAHIQPAVISFEPNSALVTAYPGIFLVIFRHEYTVESFMEKLVRFF